MKVLLLTIVTLMLLTSCAELKETSERISRIKRIRDPNMISFPTEFRATPPELIPIPDHTISAPDPETPPL